MSKGVLLILSGPSGAGKDTVLDEVAKQISIKRSISMTSRSPREGEVDGKDYYFVTRDRFEKSIKRNEVLEYTEYSGNYYGTPKGPIDEWLSNGENVILKIEVEGAENIRNIYNDVVSVFISPPSMDILEKRLRERKTDTEEDIQRRINVVKYEVSQASKYDYIVINDRLEDAVKDIITIIESEKLKTARSILKLREVF